MTVYVEYVLIDNFAVTMLIVCLSLRAMRLKLNKLRVLLSSALGAVAALLVPLLPLSSGIALVAIKLAVGVAIIFFAADYRNVSQFLRSACIFMAITFGVGGAVFAVLFMAEGDVVRAATMGYTKIPIGIIISGVFLSMFLIRIIIRALQRRRDTAPFYYRVKLFLDGQAAEMQAYLDSGNMLYDSAGRPVIVVSKEAVSALLAAKMLRRKADKPRYIEVSTVNGISRMTIFTFSKIEIYSGQAVNILYDVTVGLTDKHFEDYSCLLHPALL